MGRSEKCNIGWMASYNNPTPIEFFHLLSSSHKSSAFGKYNVLLSQAIKCCEDPVKQLELEKIKETADCHADWNVWLIERKEGLIHNEVHETNVKVHRELNTFVRNSGKQKSNDNANGETEEGSNSNNINVNYEEEKGSNSNSTNADNKKRKIIIHYILNDILLASQAEKDNLDIYCSKFSHCSVMDLWLNSEFSLFLDQELQERILHEVFDTIDNDYVTDEIHNFFSDFFNADHGKEGWCDAIRSIAIDENCEIADDYNDDNCILICGHEYHYQCLQNLQFKCQHCLGYLLNGIEYLGNLYNNRLESLDNTSILDEEDEEEDENTVDNEDNINLEGSEELILKGDLNLDQYLKNALYAFQQN
ncbi:20069_t:CDS:2 [Entrophospora sp. SA101]|nr:20069_t:CDS:2 [Entrophospora sp. SA101]